MRKTEKIVVGFCLLFFLTSLISFSQQEELQKNPIPTPPDQGMIICDNPLIDQSPPISPAWDSRHSRKYTGMVVGDYDGDSIQEVAFDFGSQGIWVYDPNAPTNWNKISNDNPEWMIAINISATSNEELFVGWDDANTIRTSWWHYTGASVYPGAWTPVAVNPRANYAYDAGDVNGDGDDEVVVQWDGGGIYVLNYTGSGGLGGFSSFKISSTQAEGFPVQFAAVDYELLHSFSDGTKFWSYSAGYPDTNWTSINSAGIDWVDSIGADIDGGTITDELMADILDQLWLYDHDTTTWTRLNFNQVCGMFPVAYDNLNQSYEFLISFCSVAGLWGINPDVLPLAGVRVSWNQPEYVLGADFRTFAEGGNNGEEVIADFGSLGVWIQLQWTGNWTRINWNDPEAMLQANLDSDPEMEIIFDFGPTGVWVWDGAGSKTGTWTRINWSNPENTAPLGDGCDR